MISSGRVDSFDVRRCSVGCDSGADYPDVTVSEPPSLSPARGDTVRPKAALRTRETLVDTPKRLLIFSFSRNLLSELSQIHHASTMILLQRLAAEETQQLNDDSPQRIRRCPAFVAVQYGGAYVGDEYVGMYDVTLDRRFW